ncbi:transketolase family protein [Magnetospirillum sp. UT-4]|uniref:transketolase family protein n=1 Tax=Magnetospirillum sp. UT-4 TaxID=2681467 RepID=UPI001384BBDB|nr:transketolase C-terminal domain-containing protein [Magnetospirillum sp. UT-4]CAA7621646.1 Transketolase subunit B [Magnetospirillum sp. UT-4]
MRNAFADTLYEIALADPRIVSIGADVLPGGKLPQLKQVAPGRFLNVGIAEQAMIGIAAGMALKGLRPFVYTMATFSLYRPFEFVRDDLCYQNLPVTVVGMGAGLAYSTLGTTHQAQEDLALACSLANMRVLSPCDPAETAQATRFCAANDGGPIYLRLGKAGEPDLTRGAEPFVFGRLRWLVRDGTDLCLLAHGPIMAMAFQVAERMRALGRKVSVASVHTLKPLDRAGIADVLGAFASVAVIEEHVAHGGLAAQVKEIAWDSQARCRLQAFCLKDQFIHDYGSPDQLLAAHGLSPDSICAALG